LQEEIDNITDEAIDAAFTELAMIAGGYCLEQELKRQQGALKLVTNIGLLKLERAKALYIKEAARPARDAYDYACENFKKADENIGKNRPGTRARAINRKVETKAELGRQEKAFR